MELIKVASYDDINTIISLSGIIWREHYTPIIGAEQVEYMLDKFLSYNIIDEYIKDNQYIFYLIYIDNNPIGYFSYSTDSGIFLSKLYIKSDYRGKGISRAVMQHLKYECLSHNYKTIWLTVNKYNTNSIAAYTHMGFKILKEQKSDIGQGYFMDDYVMELSI